MSAKECHDCGELKSLAQFSRNRGYRDGLMNRCKPCDNARRKARRDGETLAPKVLPKVRQRLTESARSIVIGHGKEPRTLAEFVAASAPEVSVLDSLPITPAAVGPLRTITQQEHIKILAGNIATIASELIDIAEVTVQDGRSLPESGFTIDLQHVHHLMSRLVEWLARTAGLEPAPA